MIRTTWLLLLCLLGGASHAAGPVRSLLEMRQANLVMQQWDTSCAAAALATMLTYHFQFPVSEEEVALGMLRRTDPLRVKFRGGFSLLDVKRYAAERGFAGDGYMEMTIDELAAHTPMIVQVNAGGYDHFVVVRRVSAAEVDIGDPGFGNYRTSRARFARTWTGIGFEVRRQ